jgi:hypothetical protein
MAKGLEVLFSEGHFVSYADAIRHALAPGLSRKTPKQNSGSPTLIQLSFKKREYTCPVG